LSYFPGMQKGNLDSVKSDAHGKIKQETVALQGVSVTRVTFDVGAKWSIDLKEYAGTNSCPTATCCPRAFGNAPGRHGRWLATRLLKERCYAATTGSRCVVREQ
jgi:hypothetical protein